MKKLLCILFIAAITSCISGGNTSDDGIKNHVKNGDAVPSFQVTATDGNKVDFPSSWFVGKRSVIAFFNSGCSDCRREMPKIRAAWEELHGEVEFIAVSRHESASDVDVYWAAFEPMPYYLDPDKSAFNKFANLYVPRIYMVGTDGKVKHFEIETFSFADGAGLVKLINEKI